VQDLFLQHFLLTGQVEAHFRLAEIHLGSSRTICMHGCTYNSIYTMKFWGILQFVPCVEVINTVPIY